MINLDDYSVGNDPNRLLLQKLMKSWSFALSNSRATNGLLRQLDQQPAPAAISQKIEDTENRLYDLLADMGRWTDAEAEEMLGCHYQLFDLQLQSLDARLGSLFVNSPNIAASLAAQFPTPRTPLNGVLQHLRDLGCANILQAMGQSGAQPKAGNSADKPFSPGF